MDSPSLFVAVMPTMALVALCTGIALTSIAGRRSGRGLAGEWLARADAFMRVAAGRKARPREPGVSHADAAEYLYVPCARVYGNGSAAETRRWVQEVPIVRKTAKLIYYASDSWSRREAVVSPGCISRELFEADTRCRHGYPPGVIPIPGGHRTGSAGRLFYATGQAAESDLCRWERERAGRTTSLAPLVSELRRTMLDAHPDRGGTAEQFIQARRRYQTALQQARVT
jgi:hypothetical protein